MTDFKELIDQNRSTMKHLVKHYAKRSYNVITVQELEQAALIGLHKASLKYSSDSEANFKTYATFVIRGSILDAIYDCFAVSRKAKVKPIFKKDVCFDSMESDFDIEECSHVSRVRDLLLKRVLLKFSPDHAQIFWDYMVSGRTQEHIGKDYGLTSSAVSLIVKKIKKDLIKHFKRGVLS